MKHLTESHTLLLLITVSDWQGLERILLGCLSVGADNSGIKCYSVPLAMSMRQMQWDVQPHWRPYSQALTAYWICCHHGVTLIKVLNMAALTRGWPVLHTGHPVWWQSVTADAIHTFIALIGMSGRALAWTQFSVPASLLHHCVFWLSGGNGLILVENKCVMLSPWLPAFVPWGSCCVSLPHTPTNAKCTF